MCECEECHCDDVVLPEHIPIIVRIYSRLKGKVMSSHSYVCKHAWISHPEYNESSSMNTHECVNCGRKVRISALIDVRRWEESCVVTRINRKDGLEVRYS